MSSRYRDPSPASARSPSRPLRPTRTCAIEASPAFFPAQLAAGREARCSPAAHCVRARLICRLPDDPWVPRACLAVERQAHRARQPLRPAFGPQPDVDSACTQWQPWSTQHARWQRGSAADQPCYRARVRSCIVRAAQTHTGLTLSQCVFQWRTAVLLMPFLFGLRVRLLMHSGRGQRRLQVYAGAVVQICACDVL